MALSVIDVRSPSHRLFGYNAEGGFGRWRSVSEWRRERVSTPQIVSSDPAPLPLSAESAVVARMTGAMRLSRPRRRPRPELVRLGSQSDATLMLDAELEVFGR
jgi:hypothetical protein